MSITDLNEIGQSATILRSKEMIQGIQQTSKVNKAGEITVRNLETFTMQWPEDTGLRVSQTIFFMKFVSNGHRWYTCFIGFNVIKQISQRIMLQVLSDLSDVVLILNEFAGGNNDAQTVIFNGGLPIHHYITRR